MNQYKGLYRVQFPAPSTPRAKGYESEKAARAQLGLDPRCQAIDGWPKEDADEQA